MDMRPKSCFCHGSFLSSTFNAKTSPLQCLALSQVSSFELLHLSQGYTWKLQALMATGFPQDSCKIPNAQPLYSQATYSTVSLEHLPCSIIFLYFGKTSSAPYSVPSTRKKCSNYFTLVATDANWIKLFFTHTLELNCLCLNGQLLMPDCPTEGCSFFLKNSEMYISRPACFITNQCFENALQWV